MNIKELKADILDENSWQMKNYALLKPDLLRLIAVVEAAKKFVPDPATIQWERREIALRDALVALESP